MRLAVVHLSDIHIRKAGNPIVSRTEQIVAAVNSCDPSTPVFLFVISGDIAYSGQPEEYTVAHEFLHGLMTSLKNLRPAAEVHFVCVPGNHDCFIPEEKVQLREVLISGILPSLREAKPDDAMLEQILKPQEAFREFRSRLIAFESASKELCHTIFLDHDQHRIQVNLYNTALLSRRKEIQGSLHIPVEALRSTVSLDSHSSLCISVFHHSYVWLESNTMVDFRRHIEATCDVALTGHQHYSHDYYKQNASGERVYYIEAAALQDEEYPSKSAFRVLLVDLDSSQERCLEFRWSSRDALYRRVQDPEWKVLNINRAVRAEFRLNSEFDSFINRVDIPLHHGRKGELKLRDIFVLPVVHPARTGHGS